MLTWWLGCTLSCWGRPPRLSWLSPGWPGGGSCPRCGSSAPAQPRPGWWPRDTIRKMKQEISFDSHQSSILTPGSRGVARCPPQCSGRGSRWVWGTAEAFSWRSEMEWDRGWNFFQGLQKEIFYANFVKLFCWQKYIIKVKPSKPWGKFTDPFDLVLTKQNLL